MIQQVAGVNTCNEKTPSMWGEIQGLSKESHLSFKMMVFKSSK
jgi:hypothetical protein